MDAILSYLFNNYIQLKDLQKKNSPADPNCGDVCVNAKMEQTIDTIAAIYLTSDNPHVKERVELFLLEKNKMVFDLITDKKTSLVMYKKIKNIIDEKL